MRIFWGFPESARKQDFHLDEAKRSRETNDTGKEQADLIFQKDNQHIMMTFLGKKHNSLPQSILG